MSRGGYVRGGCERKELRPVTGLETVTLTEQQQRLFVGITGSGE